MRKIELTEHFTKRKMLQYSLPSIFETFATTSFQMVDGYFVSNLLGLSPYVAVGLISPVFFVLYALGFMFGEGASALIAKVLGEGDQKRGCEILSMTTVVMLIFGAAVGIVSAILMPVLARLVGASDNNIVYCIEYGRMLVLFLPAFLINSGFMSLWITAEKGWLGMAVSAVNGLANVVMDWLFMGPMNMGVRGAALATSLAALIAAIITIIYFWLPNRSTLRFTRFTFRDLRELTKICTNGASSMVDSLAGNLVALMMNNQLLRYLGEMGVAAMEVYQYVVELFMAILFGIANTTITVAGYKYGEKDRKELDDLAKNNSQLTMLFGVVLCLLFLACAEPVARFYVGYDEATCAMTVRALRIMAMGCTVFGYNLFVSSFFTGIGNGLVSAIISFCGSLVAPLATMFIIPAIFGGDSIWFSIPVSNLITTLVCVIAMYKCYKQKKELW